MASNWPLHAADLRKALQYDVGQDDAGELELFMAAACERIDVHTGRSTEPTRHEVDGKVPTVFVLAARAVAKLWWQQEKKGPRARPTEGEDPAAGMAGVDLPSKVAGWLKPYPPRLYPGDAE
ncbi:hypothetical protein BKA24_001687 [Microbacterium marinum]|uniref:Phage gp6-like head-tail connector protein n=1 Tax=Microbacterium marinum TaxID=421115 RepID=A0A7W7BSQ1_9MICO|nr:phage gp6-like head-tail connector protein [Microbacterium marinum]MBB4666978.1 hypothetical protein [Microbacterium marinum]